MELGKMYFYTATITKWRHLLKPDKYKHIVLGSLRYLVERRKIAVYGFVIMPNHIHVIWELLEPNGKEFPHASFMKYTSHEIQKDLRIHHPNVLELFKVDLDTRKYHFWQRNSLPIYLYSPKVVFQKLEYIHNNPLQEKWLLAEAPELYFYSSANYYLTGKDDFGFITHIYDRLGK